jgi:dephospho-CoA kinase
MYNFQFLELFSFSLMILIYLPIFAGVAGGAASGKKTVCDMIVQQLHDQRVVLVNQVTNSFYAYIFWLNQENIKTSFFGLKMINEGTINRIYLY